MGEIYVSRKLFVSMFPNSCGYCFLCFQFERSQRNEASDRSADLDARVSSLISELASARDSSAGLERDNSELSARVSELEKARANLDSELKSAHSRLATAVSTSSGLDTNSIFQCLLP